MYALCSNDVKQEISLFFFLHGKCLEENKQIIILLYLKIFSKFPRGSHCISQGEKH